MLQWMRRGMALLLAMLLILGCACAENGMDQAAWAAYQATGDYLESLGTPQVGSVGGEWMAIGLARSGRSVPEDYYANIVNYVRENADENDRLHRVKSTENSRLILAITAIGADAANVDGHNLLKPLQDLDFLAIQGNNGPIWALIALDCGNYEIADGLRERLVQMILDLQLENGGWSLAGDAADSDMTGMALQALAADYAQNGEAGELSARVKSAVDAALECLSDLQLEDGSYGLLDGSGEIVPTSESISQIITALCALGIDPERDERFIKNGNSTIDALLGFYVEGGGFRHLQEHDLDGMATEQAYYALAAYDRLLSGKTRLYDMTDVLQANP